jgi:flagellar biosynthesis chaperone FliJ
MGKHHKENPFTAYSTVGEGYEQYLRDIQDIYRQVKNKLKTGGHAVVEVSNLKHEDNLLTTLAWDIARAISEVLHFKGEVVIAWQDGYAFGYDHSYCLIFQNI